jgi:integrase/recombinase XerD
MIIHPSPSSGSALRQRMIEDMTVRGFTAKTQHDYIRCVKTFAAFLGRSPDRATAEDLRRFQVHQTQAGLQPPGINLVVSALRFFFTVTLDRPDLARRLALVRQPHKLPLVLSLEEVTRRLEAAPGPKDRAALGAAYGAGLRVSEIVSLKVSRPNRFVPLRSRASVLQVARLESSALRRLHRNLHGPHAPWPPAED